MSVVAAREAMARSAWAEADALFAAETALGADDLVVWADASTWCNRRDRALELFERAFDIYMAQGARDRAASVALDIATAHMHGNRTAMAAGWTRRAEQLLADQVECAAHGRLHWAYSMRAQGKRQLEAALDHADKALAIAERTADRDGQAFALMRKARVLVKLSRVAEGMAFVDEAMVAAVGGELSPMCAGIIYCSTIDVCADQFDYNRAGEWTDAARRWCERKAVTGFPGICRIHRAEIMRLRGKFQDAQAEVLKAHEDLTAFHAIAAAANALYELGEIRLRMGELDAAADAFQQAHEGGVDPQPGLALLWFEQGRAPAAANALAHSLADIPQDDRLRRAKILPVQVEIAIAVGDLPTARAAVAELDETGKLHTAPALHAMIACARGALTLAEGDATGAVGCLRKAIQLWKELDAPYEMSHARVILSRAHAKLGDTHSADLELAAARATFGRLGAAHALRKTTASPALSETLAASGPPAVGPTAMPKPGDLIDGKIEIVRMLGSGGMGAVFEGLHRRTGRRVAVKLLRPNLCSDPAACQRMVEEALACGRIQHPNVVDVYDAGACGSQPYIVMELLRGESLGTRIDRERTIAVAAAVDIAVQAAAGLAAAHAAGIIHRDLKPDNVFLVGDRVKVVDFGISKTDDRASGLAETKTGVVIGTPYYMAPEQARGVRNIDARADVYGLGAVLFHALTGRPPFLGDNYNALIAEILTGELPSARSLRPEIPATLDAVLARSLARDPAARHASIAEFAAALGC
jgi:tetratricopeptide (TPR) repeat protein